MAFLRMNTLFPKKVVKLSDLTNIQHEISHRSEESIDFFFF